MPRADPGIIVHGGAGRISDGRVEERVAGCREAAMTAWAVLEHGGSALAAVEAAVELLEDNPLFNAGTGAVLDTGGSPQLSASIMEGTSLAAGAVAALRRVRNPVRLARKVLEDGRHVLLVGNYAEQFAEQLGIPLCHPADLIVQWQHKRWDQDHGTVGCVAIDPSGALAAATSTGGIYDALPGRVGDSALIGSGTYANRKVAVSCTGHGESIVRVVLAKAIADWVAEGHPPTLAAEQGLRLLEGTPRGEGGVILVDSRARLGYASNTPFMPVAWIAGDGVMHSDV